MAKDAGGHGSDARGQFGLAATLARVQRGARQIAQAHGIDTQHLGPGGPVKVQAFAPKTVGKQPWKTAKAYGNSTVAETVAKGMRVDNGKGTGSGGFMRIKVK